MSSDPVPSDDAPVTVEKLRKSPRKVPKRTDPNKGLSQSTVEALGQLHWFLVCVPSGKEFTVERILDDNGVTVFVPVETRFRRRNRYAQRKTELKFPLVPGYVLVGFPPSSMDWASVFRFRIIAGVVGREGRPARIPRPEVTRLLTRHASGEFIAPKAQQWMQTHREFFEGDRVEVLEGPFEGHVFEVTQITGQHASMVVELLGGEQCVQVPLKSLGKVGTG